MKSLKQLLLIMVCAFSIVMLSSCATIVKGNMDTIIFTSDPTGAKVVKDGKEIGVTPCEIKLFTKNYYEFVISAEGYESKTVDVESLYYGAAAIGNIFSFPIVGHIVDIANGSAFMLRPNDVRIKLNKLK